MNPPSPLLRTPTLSLPLGEPRIDAIGSDETFLDIGKPFSPVKSSVSLHQITHEEPCLYRGSDTLAINDLHWWTTAEHLVGAAARAGVRLERKDVIFAEHRANGKSRGSVVINCRSADNASIIAHWLHANDFQGKKPSPSFVTVGAGNPSKPAAPAHHTGPRPVLNTSALLAHGPTNAHGGINLNRVRSNSRAGGSIGMGWPTNAGSVRPFQQPGKYPAEATGRYAHHPIANPFVPNHTPFMNDYPTHA